RGVPIITGLSSTYLYREQRALNLPRTVGDDVRGHPQGHFVMLVGYDAGRREVLIADPLDENPPFHTAKYRLPMDRLMNAVLLGILTQDANLLVVSPRRGRKKERRRRVVRPRGTRGPRKDPAGTAGPPSRSSKRKGGKR